MTVTKSKRSPQFSLSKQPTQAGLLFLTQGKEELVVRTDLLGSAIAAIKECARPTEMTTGKFWRISWK